MNLNSIDPTWAWSPYQPSAETPWDLRAAAHLFRRAGFGASHSELEHAVSMSPVEALEMLTDQTQEPPAYRDEMSLLVRASLASGSVDQLAAQWVYRMLSTPVPLLEKTTLFWHGHFATSADKVQDAELMYEQNQLLRQHALGDFREMLQGISRDPAMLLYLDSASNRKAHPNENYAREVMELFCLGEGHYTENDIRELARCFTGWEIKRKKFRFNRYQHDSGTKTVLGQSGSFGGEQGVEIVASQATAPEFLATKLVRYFLCDEPDASDSLIKPLADELRENELHLAPTVRRILGSQLFFSQYSRAKKIRSPVEFVVGLLRCMEGSSDTYKMAEASGRLGQRLFYPPSVKGWDGGRTWINSSTLLGRSNWVREVLDNDRTRFDQSDLLVYLAQNDVDSMERLIDWAEITLFAVPLPKRLRQAVQEIASTQSDRERAMKDALHLLCASPEFQLS